MKMKNKDTRKEKIKVLQAIRKGKLNPESLEPPQVYIFIEHCDKPGVYEHNGKEYNETEYREFCKRIERKYNGSIIWNEGREYLKEDIIITMSYVENREMKTGGDNITLKIE